jgi:hypothetical protein
MRKALYMWKDETQKKEHGEWERSMRSRAVKIRELSHTY